MNVSAGGEGGGETCVKRFEQSNRLDTCAI